MSNIIETLIDINNHFWAPIGFYPVKGSESKKEKEFKDYTNSTNLIGYIPFIGTMAAIKRITKFFPKLFYDNVSGMKKLTCVVEVLRAGVEVTSCGIVLAIVDIPVFLARLAWSKYSEDITRSFERGRRVGEESYCFGCVKW